MPSSRDFQEFSSSVAASWMERKTSSGLASPRVFTVEMRQDDPAKCTSAKMAKFGFARSISAKQIPSEAIVLSPFSPISILRNDRNTLLSRGVVVIDCSWVNANAVFDARLKGIKRRLPVLMAGNPTNYSKLNSLSSLEAAAAALYITGFPEFSEKLLSLYKWGHTFLTLNQDALNDYASAKTQEDIQNLENDYFHRTKE